ncbi:MAG: alpha-amylase family glycosyl hydrolase [Bacteroidota bacterium]
MKSLLSSFITLLLVILVFRPASGQVIVTVPVYPTDLDSCTVIFDASKGNAGLYNVSPPIYAHTGVITNLSTSPSDWKYVIAAWGENIPKAKMTSLGNNLYSIKLLPGIRAFYGVPAGESILKLAFVFRNSDGSKTGKEANGGDIFANVYPTITSVKINLPQNKNLFLSSGDPIPVDATSPLANTMKLFLNGTLIKTISGHEITDTVMADNFGHNWTKYWVKVLAVNDTAAAADSFCYTVIPSPSVAPLPAGIKAGINYQDSTRAVLCLYAPGKNSCFAIGDFTNWEQDSSHYMFKTPDGNNFWIQLSNLVPRREYIFQYLVDGTIKIGDPFADKVSDPNDLYIDEATYPGLIPYPTGKTTGVATVLQTAQTPYPWASSAFTAPAVTDLVIYELLIRDFTAAHTYLSLIDTLNYLKNLGINAIELMPVMEFEGNISWGYNPNYSFAVDKYYGSKNTLKQFVEAAHSKGMAVILDIVCNHHFGSSPLVQLYWDSQNQRPAANSPWFNPVPKHPYNVGLDFNHDLPATRSYMLRLVKYWLQEYHADGFRFDLSKGFTQVNSYPDNVTLWGQYDQNRINILNTYADTVWSVNPAAYMVLEHFADNSEEKVLANAGMMPWGNGNNSYNNASGGWVSGSSSDLNWGSYKNRSWNQPDLVWYMESHDEERQMYKDYSAGNSSKPPYNPKDTATALQRGALCATFFLSIPGPKMIWQFGELGYDYSINYPSGTSASRLDPKPVRWDYYTQWGRKYLYNVYRSMIELKKNLPVFRTSNFTMDASAQAKRIVLTDPSMDAVVLGNFDVIDRNVIPNFTKTGMWYEYFKGDSLSVTDVAAPLAFTAGEYRLYTTVRLPKPVFTGIGTPANDLQAGCHIRVFPNPSDGPLNFELLNDKPVNATLSVYDLSGRPCGTVFEGRLNQGVQVLQWEPARKLKPGIYFYKLVSAEGSFGGKIIIL